MLSLLLIAIHAVSGLIALTAGVLVLKPPDRESPGLVRVYLGALWLMVLALAAAVARDWAALDAGGRVLFGALTVFAGFIGWRGWAAREHLRRRAAGWDHAYVENIGFTLIALFDGFVIIAALDLGAPIWLVVAIAILAVLAGRFALGRMERRVTARSSGTISTDHRKERLWT